MSKFMRILQNGLFLNKKLQTTMLVHKCMTSTVPRSRMSLGWAIKDALYIALTMNRKLVLFEEGITCSGCVELLENKAPETPVVINKQFSEHGIVHIGIGTDIDGSTVIADVQYSDRQGCIFQPLDESLRCLPENILKLENLTMIAPIEPIRRGAMNHTDSNKLLYKMDGIKVVMPRRPEDAKGLLLSCIKHDTPCVFIEPNDDLNKSVHEMVRLCHYTTPLGKAEIILEVKDEGHIEGKRTCVTLIGYGPHVNILKDEVAKDAEKFGILCEVIDLRTLLPWDQKTVKESVKKTGRCIISEEVQIIKGLANKIEYTLQNENENTPIQKVCGYTTDRLVDLVRKIV
ncbi:2-oxoisovalerate dehydrogenase subunit beta, mitochondrial-like isoform X2 [Mytilus californianus]|uniref:2-oxoisovalerate dehydrogenase subunit beta, mitochondrial-like isoform X2 n=1 Tax=Mytilus californianus TaxID=6549 RepID=UPI0022461393|nr:2-oxoisovalerate dehydrogenase subunit beta, mitochondrial-like isoform X2 [Mytilus californianus]